MIKIRYVRRLFCVLAASFLLLFFLAELPQAEATVLYVPAQYSTIQTAVDMAAPGDIIEVSPGIYPENVIVEQSLTIVGQDKSTTIVDGNDGGYAFWLGADEVTIRGLTIRDCSNYGIIAYYSGGHTIDDNIFINNAYGVHITNSPSASIIANNTFIDNSLRGINLVFSSDNAITSNSISESSYGVRLSEESQFNSITNNTIIGSSHGIHLGYSSNNNVEQNMISSIITGIASVHSDYTDIQNNTVSESAYGIELYSSIYNTVFVNTIVQSGYGIYLVYANDNTIDSNLASNNDLGIQLYDSDSNTIIQNTFSFNAQGIDLIYYSTGNTIAWNNILNNTMQMRQDATSGGNIWNKMTGGITYGNYWSNYTGEDTDGDGVGDTHPFPHMGVDNYPLINPWTTVHDVAVISATTSANQAYQGETVDVTVVVRNEGTVTETFNVTVKRLNRLIGTEEVTNLARLETATLIFNWDTTPAPAGVSYEITAKIEPINGERDKLDNAFMCGEVFVKLPGDVDGDFDVDGFDMSMLCATYGCTPGDPNWEEECDINGDGVIDGFDLTTASGNYGKTY